MSMLKLWEPLLEDDFWALPSVWGSRRLNNRWSPAVDILEEKDQLKIKADLPGLRKEDVKIRVEDGVLTLSGERHFTKEEKKENYHRIERAYGSFSRSFTLPTGVKADQIEAKMEDGLLTITVPKTEQAKAKQIEVH